MEKLKLLRKIITDHYESFSAFLDKDNFASIEQWSEVLTKIFRYLNNNYHRYDGYGYSDLEFYLIKGLIEKDQIERRLGKSLITIIDEFQDTSEIQFNIIKLILGNQFEKMFCVGDLKQAIYGFRGGDTSVFK